MSFDFESHPAPLARLPTIVHGRAPFGEGVLAFTLTFKVYSANLFHFTSSLTPHHYFSLSTHEFGALTAGVLRGLEAWAGALVPSKSQLIWDNVHMGDHRLPTIVHGLAPFGEGVLAFTLTFKVYSANLFHLTTSLTPLWDC